MPHTRQPLEHQPAGFIVIRLPALPIDDFVEWSKELAVSELGTSGDSPCECLEEAITADRIRLRRILSVQMNEAYNREAIRVASTSVYDNMGVWEKNPSSAHGRKIERTLVKYFIRMATRPTPFGMFAGTSVGTIGDETKFQIEASNRWHRHIRPDMSYVQQLVEWLEGVPETREHLIYHPNTSLYRMHESLRLTESRTKNVRRSYFLVTIDRSEAIEAVLSAASDGATISALVEKLTSMGAPQPTAKQFIHQLIDSQVLVSELCPSATGPEPMRDLMDRLEGMQSGPVSRISQRLKDIDLHLTMAEHSAVDDQSRAIDLAETRIHDLVDNLRDTKNTNRPVQVDLHRSTPEVVLSRTLCAKILRGVEVLHSTFPHPSQDDLQAFCEKYLQTYGNRIMRLTEVLDSDSGLGFPVGKARTMGNDMLRGLPHDSRAEPVSGANWRLRDAHLLRRIQELSTSGKRVLDLTASDMDKIAQDDRPIQASFSILVRFYQTPEGSENGPRIFLQGSIPSASGMEVLGRFCHGDDALRDLVADYLEKEQSIWSDALLAEINHIPEGKLGNVILRPKLRRHEITYLAKPSSADVSDSRSILASDLWVNVEGGRVRLYSRQLQSEIIPRLTCAHNFNMSDLPMYRFLCEVAQPVPLGWDWGVLADSLWLPRVTYEDLIFAPEMWTFRKPDLDAVFPQDDVSLYRWATRLRKRFRLPRWVCLVEGDNVMDLDLDNIMCIELLAHMWRQREHVRVSECLWSETQYLLRDNHGRHFAHEIVIPFSKGCPGVARDAETAATDGPPPSSHELAQQADKRISMPPSLPEVHFPGSSWLHGRLSCPPSLAEQFLLNTLRPALTDDAEGTTPCWYFVRSMDPEPSIEFTIAAADRPGAWNILSQLQQGSTALSQRCPTIKLSLSTHHRATTEFGGTVGRSLAEDIFCADSNFVLGFFASEGRSSAELWKVAILSLYTLLEELGLSVADKIGVLEWARREIAPTVDTDVTLRRTLGRRYREHAPALEKMFKSREIKSCPRITALLEARSEALGPTIAKLHEGIQSGSVSTSLQAFVFPAMHSHVHRLFPYDWRRHELLLYDLLLRSFRSERARFRQK